MLYQIYETQRSLMEPFSDLAQAVSKLYSNPLSPLGQNPWAQRIAAGYDLLHRLGKDYEKPAFDIRTVAVDGVNVAIYERVEINKPFCELRRFKRFTDDPATLTNLKQQPVVLIVAPLSGHYATLLRDTVRTMLRDHKVYVTDWRNARLVPQSEGDFHLDDYVNYVQDFVRYLQERYGNCHVISVCQPTVPVMAAVSLMATRGEKTPLSMTMMGGPIDASRSPTAVNTLAVHRSFEWFENNVIYRVPSNFPGAGRRVYPGFLQYAGFVAMNPDRHANSHYDYFRDLIKGDNESADSHRQFYDEYNAVLDMDAHYYLETIQTVFQEFKLVKGTWDVRSPGGELERVRPADITTTALLTVEGELDDISGAGQTAAAHDMCTGIPEARRQHYKAEGAGHYGIFSGRRWREMVYPVVKAFIWSHNGNAQLVAATATASASTPAVAEAMTEAVIAPAPLAAQQAVAADSMAATPEAQGAQTVAEAVAETAAATATQEAATATSDDAQATTTQATDAQAAAAPAPAAAPAKPAGATPARRTAAGNKGYAGRPGRR
jgi:poly(3-hydroxybutyrate) depolymerase